MEDSDCDAWYICKYCKKNVRGKAALNVHKRESHADEIRAIAAKKKGKGGDNCENPIRNENRNPEVNDVAHAPQPKVYHPPAVIPNREKEKPVEPHVIPEKRRRIDLSRTDSGSDTSSNEGIEYSELSVNRIFLPKHIAGPTTTSTASSPTSTTYSSASTPHSFSSPLPVSPRLPSVPFTTDNNRKSQPTILEAPVSLSPTIRNNSSPATDSSTITRHSSQAINTTIANKIDDDDDDDIEIIYEGSSNTSQRGGSVSSLSSSPSKITLSSPPFVPPLASPRNINSGKTTTTNSHQNPVSTSTLYASDTLPSYCDVTITPATSSIPQQQQQQPQYQNEVVNNPPILPISTPIIQQQQSGNSSSSLDMILQLGPEVHDQILDILLRNRSELNVFSTPTQVPSSFHQQNQQQMTSTTNIVTMPNQTSFKPANGSNRSIINDININQTDPYNHHNNSNINVSNSEQTLPLNYNNNYNISQPNQREQFKNIDNNDIRFVTYNDQQQQQLSNQSIPVNSLTEVQCLELTAKGVDYLNSGLNSNTNFHAVSNRQHNIHNNNNVIQGTENTTSSNLLNHLYHQQEGSSAQYYFDPKQHQNPNPNNYNSNYYDSNDTNRPNNMGPANLRPQPSQASFQSATTSNPAQEHTLYIKKVQGLAHPRASSHIVHTGKVQQAPTATTPTKNNIVNGDKNLTCPACKIVFSSSVHLLKHKCTVPTKYGTLGEFINQVTTNLYFSDDSNSNSNSNNSYANVVHPQGNVNVGGNRSVISSTSPTVEKALSSAGSVVQNSVHQQITNTAQSSSSNDSVRFNNVINNEFIPEQSQEQQLMQTQHQQDGKIYYTCYCNRTFPKQSSLKRHQTVSHKIPVSGRRRQSSGTSGTIDIDDGILDNSNSSVNSNSSCDNVNRTYAATTTTTTPAHKSPPLPILQPTIRQHPLSQKNAEFIKNKEFELTITSVTSVQELPSSLSSSSSSGNKSFSSSSTRETESSVDMPKNFQCIICSQEGKEVYFVTSAGMENHLKSHKNVQLKMAFGCSICKQKFSGSKERDEHILQNHPSQVVMFQPERSTLQRHSDNIEAHRNRTSIDDDGDVIALDSSPEPIQGDDDVSAGVDAVDSPRENPSRSRPSSSSSSTRTEKVLEHDSANKDKGDSLLNRCYICTLPFSSVEELNSHIFTIHAQASGGFSCDIGNCGKVFNAENSLAHHKKNMHANTSVAKTEDKETVYSCELCNNKFFASESHLNQHQQTMHLNTPPSSKKLQSFDCECGSEFPFLSALRIHCKMTNHNAINSN